MQAKWLLLECAEINGEFDSDMLFERLRLKYGPSTEKELNKKRISNKLNRLHCMRLLSKRRIKRQICTSKGKLCNKGYKYKYMISKQGTSYSAYIKSATRKPDYRTRSLPEDKKTEALLALMAMSILMESQNQITYQRVTQNRNTVEPHQSSMKSTEKISSMVRAIRKIDEMQGTIVHQKKQLEEKDERISKLFDLFERLYRALGNLVPTQHGMNEQVVPVKMEPAISSDSNPNLIQKTEMELLTDARNLILKGQNDAVIPINELIERCSDGSGNMCLADVLDKFIERGIISRGIDYMMRDAVRDGSFERNL